MKIENLKKAEKIQLQFHLNRILDTFQDNFYTKQVQFNIKSLDCLHEIEIYN